MPDTPDPPSPKSDQAPATGPGLFRRCHLAWLRWTGRGGPAWPPVTLPPPLAASAGQGARIDGVPGLLDAAGDADRGHRPAPADRGWLERVQRTLDHAQRHPGYRFVLVAVQLRGVRAALAELPAGSADELRAEVARRLALGLRPGDAAAPLVSDDDGFELLAVIEDRGPTSWPAHLVPLLAELAEPYTVAFHPLTLQVHLAYADRTQAGPDAVALVDSLRAIAARAVREGFREPLALDPELTRRDLAEREALAQVQAARAQREFTLELAPVHDLADGRLLQQRATLVWCHPQRGRLTEAEFFPDAAGPDAMLAWTLEALALADAASTPAPVSLALPAALCDRPQLLDALTATARRCGSRCARIELRWSEAALRDCSSAPGVLQAAQALGFRLAVQDLGAAASLSVLARWPLHGFVIDAPIVAALPEGESQRVLVQGLVGLAQHLGLQPVAEGVSNAAQRQCLLELGVRAGSGPAAIEAARRETIPA